MKLKTFNNQSTNWVKFTDSTLITVIHFKRYNVLRTYRR